MHVQAVGKKLGTAPQPWLLASQPVHRSERSKPSIWQLPQLFSDGKLGEKPFQTGPMPLSMFYLSAQKKKSKHNG
jgi:hypothetical protein